MLMHQQVKAKTKAKPAWALTEQQLAEQQAADEHDLLSFAEGLDWQNFLQQLDDESLEEAFKVMPELRQRACSM